MRNRTPTKNSFQTADSADVPVPGMAEQTAGDLNGLTQPAPTTDKKHVTIPYDEWEEFKKQNERMLEALNGTNSGGATKKRKRASQALSATSEAFPSASQALKASEALTNSYEALGAIQIMY